MTNSEEEDYIRYDDFLKIKHVKQGTKYDTKK